MTAPSKTDQVSAILRSSIKLGKSLPGSRLAGMREMARKFNVSTLIISRALEMLERERLVRREHGRGVFVEQWTEDDIINVYMLFWGLVEEYKNNYFEEFAKIAYPPVMPADFSFNLRAVMKKSDEYHHLEAELARIDNSPDINCAIFGSVPFNAEHIRKFKNLHCPFIMLGDLASGNIEELEYNQITGDNYKHGQHCLEFMAQRDYREISLLTLNRKWFFYEQFCRGIEDAASETGIKVNMLEMPEDIHHHSKNRSDIRQEYDRYIKAAPSAFFKVPVIVNALKEDIMIEALAAQDKLSDQLPMILPDFDSKYLTVFYQEIFKMIKKVVEQPQHYYRELIDVPFIINDLVGNRRYLNNQGLVTEIK
ncbi:MAG: GntR family transcriptional regulator [Victivallaceae bacterium]|nr:GntR family transcriptional regulator [Victivallaceae bacterium]